MGYIAGKQTIADQIAIAARHLNAVSYVYPSLADGVLLTAAAGAWAMPDPITYTTILPANQVPFDYVLHFVSIEAISDNDVYQLFLYSGADGEETQITAKRFVRTDKRDSVFGLKIAMPIQKANTPIKGILACKSASQYTARVSLEYYPY